MCGHLSYPIAWGFSFLPLPVSKMKMLITTPTASRQETRFRKVGLGAATMLFALGLGLQSCQQEKLSLVSPVEASADAATINSLQKDFAKVLVMAVKADPELRAFLKTEANKQFDGDYDILYHMVKDVAVNGGPSVHERLAKYTEEAKLAAIEEKAPLLTIFIPRLPSGFAPETWNTQTEVPVVAVSLRGDNEIPYYGAEGKEEVMKPGQIPGFPTLLIKQNERVTVSGPGQQKAELKCYENSKFAFSFIDKAFKGVQPEIYTRTAAPSTPAPTPAQGSRLVPYIDNVTIENKVLGALVICGVDPNAAVSQRDWVYYNMTPQLPTGVLQRNYREYIRTMTFSVDALNKMSDQTEDPKFNSGTPNPSSWWTEGRYEIQASVLINSRNGLGPNYTRIISVDPRNLYDISYRNFGGFYIAQGVIPKVFYSEIDIVPWDLDSYGSAWKFVFLEHDVAGTDTYSTSNTSTFGTNFEINASTGEKTKIGGKFGISTTSSNTATHTVSKTLGDDVLGEAILTYDRPIIVSDVYPNGYTIYEITTGGQYSYLSVCVEPKAY